MKRLEKIKKEIDNILYRNCLFQAVICSILSIIFGPSSVILLIYDSSIIIYCMVGVWILFEIIAIVLWVSFVKYYVIFKPLRQLKTSYTTSRIINFYKLSFIYNIYYNKKNNNYDISGVILTDDKNNKFYFIFNNNLKINKKNKEKLKQKLLKELSVEVYYKSNVIESVKE